ncbi:hypothetical protein HispidOSU_014629 [Sigmodon hispidus]
MGCSHKASVMKLCRPWRTHRPSADAAMRSEIGIKESKTPSFVKTGHELESDPCLSAEEDEAENTNCDLRFVAVQTEGTWTSQGFCAEPQEPP